MKAGGNETDTYLKGASFTALLAAEVFGGNDIVISSALNLK